MVIQTVQITPPKDLPFLKAICWQVNDVQNLTLDEMLDRYERGWQYRGVLGDFEGAELEFIRKLAKEYGSWISIEI